MYVVIDGEVIEVTVQNYGSQYMLSDGGRDWYVFPDADVAGEAAREYWEDMAQNDPEEFTCMVGEKTLVAWALGQSAGPGSTWVKSLEEWLDLWLETPEEHFASYDGGISEGTVSKTIQEELDFDDKHVVFYRHN